MSYLFTTFNHLREIQKAATFRSVKLTMDFSTFLLEAKCAGKYYTLYPQFVGRIDGQLMYSPQISENTTAIIGWLPYLPISLDSICDKIQFKRLMQSQHLKTPRFAENAEEIDYPFIVKNSKGSFGKGLQGPFDKNGSGDIKLEQQLAGHQNGTSFAEEFFVGTAIKVWFWGSSPIYAHNETWPRILGTGQQSVRELVQMTFQRLGEEYTGVGDQNAIARCLDFQSVDAEHVLESGKSVWIDYRYGRTYRNEKATNKPDSAWDHLSPTIQAECEKVGNTVAEQLVAHFGAPTLFSVDGVIDQAESIWWLEANTNPMLPPTSYQIIFDTLFRNERRK
jgi:hypothetical protein